MQHGAVLPAVHREEPGRNHRLQVPYQRPYHQRLGYDDIEASADTLQDPTSSWTSDQLWHAY